MARSAKESHLEQKGSPIFFPKINSKRGKIAFIESETRSLFPPRRFFINLLQNRKQFSLSLSLSVLRRFRITGVGKGFLVRAVVIICGGDLVRMPPPSTAFEVRRLTVSAQRVADKLNIASRWYLLIATQYFLLKQKSFFYVYYR